MKVLHHHLGNARLALLAFLLVVVTSGSGNLGCREAPAGPDLPPAQALRLRFPDQARAVLAPDEGGATVRPRGESVELLDASGVVRLSVTAPVAYAAGGRAVRQGRRRGWSCGWKRRGKRCLSTRCGPPLGR